MAKIVIRKNVLLVQLELRQIQIRKRERTELRPDLQLRAPKEFFRFRETRPRGSPLEACHPGR